MNSKWILFSSFTLSIVKDQVKMDYHQRVTLLAYYKQEKYGVFSPEKDTNTGYFDLVGSDRRYVCIHQ